MAVKSFACVDPSLKRIPGIKLLFSLCCKRNAQSQKTSETCRENIPRGEREEREREKEKREREMQQARKAATRKEKNVL